MRRPVRLATTLPEPAAKALHEASKQVKRNPESRLLAADLDDVIRRIKAKYPQHFRKDDQ